MRYLACCVLFASSAALTAEPPSVTPGQEKPNDKTSKEPCSPPQRPHGSDRHRVERVIDGANFVLDDGRFVQLIGIVCPPRFSKDPAEKALASRAVWVTSNLVEGVDVWLEYDEQKKDRMDRDLAYVWALNEENHILLNAELIRQGVAKVKRGAPNLKHHEYLLQVQRGPQVKRLTRAPSEERRQEIFRAIVAAQDRGVGDVLAYSLVAARFDLSTEQVRKIGVEGAQRRWSFQAELGTTDHPDDAKGKLRTYPMGRPVQVGSLEWCVHKATWRDQITDNPFAKGEADANYLVVELTVKNVGMKSTYVPRLKLLDSRQRQHTESSKRAYLKDRLATLKELNPGVSCRGSTVFDVPKGVRYAFLALPGGLLSAKGEEAKPILLRARVERTNKTPGPKTTVSTEEEEDEPEPSDFKTELPKPRFIADWATKRYHYPACRRVANIQPLDRFEYSSVARARAAGFYACKHCRAPKK